MPVRGVVRPSALKCFRTGGQPSVDEVSKNYVLRIDTKIRFGILEY